MKVGTNVKFWWGSALQNVQLKDRKENGRIILRWRIARYEWEVDGNSSGS